METFAFPTLEGALQGADPAEVQAGQLLEAIETARVEGFAAGLADADRELGPARDALAAAAQGLQELQTRTADELEQAAVELALQLAEKILHARLELAPEAVAGVVTGALRRTMQREALVLEVNPADVELVRGSIPAIEGQLGSLPKLEVVGERRVPRGGCVVRTPDGEIDARLETQLARAGELLRESLAPAS